VGDIVILELCGWTFRLRWTTTSYTKAQASKLDSIQVKYGEQRTRHVFKLKDMRD